MRNTLLLLVAVVMLGALSFGQNGGYCPDCGLGGEHGCRYVQSVGMYRGCFCHFNGKQCVYTGNLCSCVVVGEAIICACDGGPGGGAADPEVKAKLQAATAVARANLLTEKDPEQLAANVSMLEGKDTVESVKARWVALFKDDPDGMVEIFHVGGESCLSQMVYTLGILEAGVATNHPVEFIKGGSSAEDPIESKLKQ